MLVLLNEAIDLYFQPTTADTAYMMIVAYNNASKLDGGDLHITVRLDEDRYCSLPWSYKVVVSTGSVRVPAARGWEDPP